MRLNGVVLRKMADDFFVKKKLNVVLASVSTAIKFLALADVFLTVTPLSLCFLAKC